MHADELDPPERPDRVYAAAMARSVWGDAPTARLTYRSTEDSVVVDLVETEATHELAVADGLLVEFDGSDPDAHPVALYLSRIRTDPGSRAVERARDLLGERIWSAVESLVTAGAGEVDVTLVSADVTPRRAAWRAMVAWLGDRVRVVVPEYDWAIGVEVLPGRITAVLTDGGEAVLDEVTERPTANDEHTVVETIGRVVRRLAARHPGTDAERCPVGVQIGGPVDRATGIVKSYDKPLHPDDEQWKGVPLRALVGNETRRPVYVSNDAEALAAYETRFGIGRDVATFALLMVGQGIGAALVRDGQVEDFPMEIGVFVPAPDVDLDETPDQPHASIEARSGVRSIVNDVAALCAPALQVEDLAGAAAAVAVPGVLDRFARAGAGLARGIAAVQAVVDPPQWVLYAPSELADESTPTGREFVRALNEANRFIHYHDLNVVRVMSRPLDYRRGAVAAVVASSMQQSAEK